MGRTCESKNQCVLAKYALILGQFLKNQCNFVEFALKIRIGLTFPSAQSDKWKNLCPRGRLFSVSRPRLQWPVLPVSSLTRVFFGYTDNCFHLCHHAPSGAIVCPRAMLEIFPAKPVLEFFGASRPGRLFAPVVGSPKTSSTGFGDFDTGNPHL